MKHKKDYDGTYEKEYFIKLCPGEPAGEGKADSKKVKKCIDILSSLLKEKI